METNINISGILIFLLILTPFLIIFLHVILGAIFMGMQKKLNLLILIQVWINMDILVIVGLIVFLVFLYQFSGER